MAGLLATAGTATYAADDAKPSKDGALLLAVNSNETRTQRVKVAVEVSGQMKMNPTGREVKFLPMSVTADQLFLQRRLPETKPAGKDSAATRLVRHYETAETKFNLKNTEFSEKLRDERRLVVLQAESDEGIYFSPEGPLLREELELIDVPGTGVLPESLLPGKALKVGETWPVPDAAVVRLLSLDAVHKHDVVGKFDELRDGIAILSLEGKVTGAVGGVSSEVNLKAKINLDPKEQLLTWIALSFTENRAVGHAQPGYDVTTRIRILTALTDDAPELSEKSLSMLPLTAGLGQKLLTFRSEKGGLELNHDRRWRVMTERYDSAVLRLVDRGELIAQCNIAKLKNFAKDEKLTIEAFQGDVKKALEQNKGTIAEASQNTTDNGLLVYRLLVTGAASEIPIQWTYYHVSDSEGRRASLVFTIDAKLVEKYAHIDQELISGFRLFDPPKSAGEPTPAEKPAGETAQKPSTATK
ncbi:hypothetical protein [Anatilimnocola floriformis]|uniref:hypothetical protein n=1 Tax=Anatilimnocola floriformis TaxID=2948575 RepID=UPI0020C58C9A|nr:hypothetical protein [Anatilimnocola floriformis]